MKTRIESRATLSEVNHLISTHVSSQNRDGVEVSKLSAILNIPQSELENQLGRYRAHSGKGRLLVDKSGILSAAIAFGLISLGLVGHTVSSAIRHRGHPTVSIRTPLVTVREL